MLCVRLDLFRTSDKVLPSRAQTVLALLSTREPFQLRTGLHKTSEILDIMARAIPVAITAVMALLASAVQANWDSEWAGTIVPGTTVGVPEPIPAAKGCRVQVSSPLPVLTPSPHLYPSESSANTKHPPTSCETRYRAASRPTARTSAS